MDNSGGPFSSADLQPLAGSSAGRRLGRSPTDNEVDSEPVRMDTASFEPSDLWGLSDLDRWMHR